MGAYLYNSALMLFLLIVYVVFHETQLYQEHLMVAKANVEEAAASGAQYFTMEEYGDGYYNFTEEQSVRAIEYSIKTNFKLNEDFTAPTNQGYWRDQFDYEVTFIDYTSPQYKGFPADYKFNHFGKEYETTLSGPSVIVTIDLGKQLYHSKVLQSFKSDNFVTGIHTFEE